MPAAEDTAEQQSLATGRRSFFGQVLVAGAGAVALLVGRTSAAQPSVGQGATPNQSTARDAISSSPASGRRMTTQAVGEEGGGWFGSRPGQVTTYALGEEGNGPWPPRRPSYQPPGRVTTYALGEEGSYYPPRRRRPPRYTTYALGEEGGYRYYR
jgi:hypothetical protein